MTAIEIPEWGSPEVFLRKMSAHERAAFIARIRPFLRANNVIKVYAHLIQRSLADERGNLVFSPSDINAIAGKASDVLFRIAKAAAVENGLSDKWQQSPS